MANYYRLEDVKGMLARFGRPIVVGGVQVQGLVDRSDGEVGEGHGTHSLGEELLITVETDALPELAQGVPVTVDGESFTVNEVHKVVDGALTRFWVVRP